MATYLPIQCPILWEEFRRRLRGNKAQAVLILYSVILIVLFFFANHLADVSNDPRSWPEFGRTLWHISLVCQLVIICLISPALTAGSISAEREHGTLELLLLTRMSSTSVVLGKFFGAIGQMLFTMFAGLPIISTVFFFGGVSPLEMLGGYAVILATGIGFASLGFLASCLFSKMATSVAWAYGFMLLILIGLPLGIYLLFEVSGFPIDSDPAIYAWMNVLNPFFAIMFMLDPYGTDYLPIWAPAVALLMMSTLILAECTMIVRRLRGLSKRFVPRTLKKPARANDVVEAPDQSAAVE